ncbi:hypothetical protein CPB83DRAFT_732075, partial [Crepidotus variabilis]
MSLRAFTVFQDAPASEPLQPRVLRSNVMATRASTRNIELPAPATEFAPLDKENYDPVTGERAGPSTLAGKKRKTGVLAAKVQPPTTETKLSKKDKDSQPEQKKRKASTSGPATSKSKSVKKDVKITGLSKKTTKRTGSRKMPSLPRLKEEEESGKTPVTQEEIDSRCKDLTVRPLADVSEAYDELAVFGTPSPVAEATQEKPKLRTVKAASVEPEIRDYFEPSIMSSTATNSTRLRAVSVDAPEPRAFSTPERKRIYAAFTFSSPA